MTEVASGAVHPLVVELAATLAHDGDGALGLGEQARAVAARMQRVRDDDEVRRLLRDLVSLACTLDIEHRAPAAARTVLEIIGGLAPAIGRVLATETNWQRAQELVGRVGPNTGRDATAGLAGRSKGTGVSLKGSGRRRGG